MVITVFFSIAMSSGPSPRMNGREPVPQVAPIMSSNTLLDTRMWLVRWLGSLLSMPRMFTPPAVCRIRLFWNVTRCTTTQGAVPLWLRGVKTIG